MDKIVQDLLILLARTNLYLKRDAYFWKRPQYRPSYQHCLRIIPCDVQH